MTHLTDQEKITYFKSIFSEEAVDEWLAILDKGFVCITKEKVKEYKIFKKNNRFFENREINQAYINFNKAFLSLDRYLSRFSYNELCLCEHQQKNTYWKLRARLENTYESLSSVMNKKQKRSIFTGENKIVLYFDESIPRLYSNHLGKTLHYDTQRGSGRAKIIRLLIQADHRYVKAESLGSSDSVRREIANIRKKIESIFSVDGKMVIDSKRGPGYRIHPDCKIVIDSR